MSKIILSILLILLLSPPAAHAEKEIVATDVLLGTLPAISFAIAYFKDDVEGEKQWLRNVAVNQALTSVLRLGFNETSWGERPNGHPYGFPSGHVAFAGAAATFLDERYGWKYGLPAYAATGYIAYVRVKNDKHHWRDVIAAAALSYGVAKLFVTPQDATYIAPVIGPEFLGLRLERSF